MSNKQQQQQQQHSMSLSKKSIAPHLTLDVLRQFVYVDDQILYCDLLLDLFEKWRLRNVVNCSDSLDSLHARFIKELESLLLETPVLDECREVEKFGARQLSVSSVVQASNSRKNGLFCSNEYDSDSHSSNSVSSSSSSSSNGRRSSATVASGSNNNVAEDSTRTIVSSVQLFASTTDRRGGAAKSTRGVRQRHTATSGVVAASSAALSTNCLCLARLSLQMQPNIRAGLTNTSIFIDLAAWRRREQRTAPPTTIAEWQLAVKLLPRRVTDAALAGLERVFAIRDNASRQLYLVLISNTASCSCDEYVTSNDDESEYCLHVMFVLIKILCLPLNSLLLLQHRWLNTELSALYGNRALREQLLDRTCMQLKQTDQQQSQDNDNDNAAVTSVDSECRICFQLISETDSSVTSRCCSNCRRSFHVQCMQVWQSVRQQNESATSLPCPSCLAPSF